MALVMPRNRPGETVVVGDNLLKNGAVSGGFFINVDAQVRACMLVQQKPLRPFGTVLGANKAFTFNDTNFAPDWPVAAELKEVDLTPPEQSARCEGLQNKLS